MILEEGFQAAALRKLLPQPLRSLRGRRASELSVELYRLGDMDLCAVHDEHLVSIQLSSVEEIYQRRGARERKAPAAPGEVIITPAGEPKTWRRRGNGEVLLIAMSPRMLDDVLVKATGHPGAHAQLVDNFGTRDPDIEALGRSLCRELEHPGIGSRFYVETVVRQVALLLLRRYCAPAECELPPQHMPPHKLRTAHDYIARHLGDDLTVPALARSVGMSPHYFAHAFREATGIPPHRYVLESRLAQARRMLREGESTLAEIAQQVGFASASHFSVAFRKAMGRSPSDYRKDPLAQ